MIKKIILKLIKIYQQMPLKSHGYCKHVPTCSEYAYEAINTYGVFKGGLLSVKRILKCNPFGSYGYDPVPKKEKERCNMKKINKLLMLFLCSILFFTGCEFIEDDSEKQITYTSVYPVEYILDQLYGENLTIKSIYPDGQNYNNYKLTNKILSDYGSTAEFFIYNSIITKEKDYAVSMINKNKSVKIIDASLGMPYINGVEETWLSPGNYLMMASNIENGLKEYITETLEIQKIEENFDKLKLDLSEIDAELKNVGSSHKTIIVGNDLFKYLESYGFNVISIEENENLTEKTIYEVRNLLANKSVKSIFLSDNSEETEFLKSLENDYGVQIVRINTLSTITSDERVDKKDYKSIMLDNINSIKLGINM